MKLLAIVFSINIIQFVLGKIILNNDHVNITNSNSLYANSSYNVNNDHPVPSETYSHKASLDTDKHYVLFWNPNATHITFEVHVKTRGYVGFGISPNGKMYPADVVVGWVANNGTGHLKDCHTVGHVAPKVDQSQDWILIHGEENSFGTMLKFVRALDTCDTDDIKITDDTMRLIFSYHHDDPVSFNSLIWHGASRRGAKSVLLLSGPKMSRNPLPSDSKHFDFTGKQIHVPGSNTTYMCSGFRFPKLDRKHHVIKYVPIVQPGNERHVHHIVLRYCTEPMDPSLDGAVYDCYKNAPKAFWSCYSIFLAWAIGGEEYNFPDNVGMPLGTPGDPAFFVLETHYDNPTMKTDIIDSSGLRIIYTPTLRKFDASAMAIGELSTTAQFIPPFEKDFVEQGFCSEECLHKGLDSKPEGINVFAVFHHMHLLGRKISTRIVRNGTEIEPIAIDEHYDFDYQDIRALNKERKILAGDRLIVDCHYDSSMRTSPTVGGESTREEMCFSFILYYPKMAVSHCLSTKTYDNLPPNADGLTTNPYETLMSWNWSDPTVRQEFKDIKHNTSYVQSCMGKTLQPEYSTITTAYPELEQTYVPAKKTCSSEPNKIQNQLKDFNSNQTSIASTIPSEQFTHKTSLDINGSFTLFWKTNKTHITFKVTAKTRGYIGFGISPNGKMYPSDVVIGWVGNDGTAFLKDCHTVGHVAPFVDQSQDWILLHGEENSFGTSLKFVRALKTCDKDDIEISDDTAHVIYSYHPDDPVSMTSLPWHGATRRGSKSMLFMSKVQEANMPSDVKTFDFFNRNFHVPGKDTTYHCSTFQLPDLGKKHHMIKYEPVITPGNELHVHHFILNHCIKPMDRTLAGRDFDCYNHKPKAYETCYIVYIAWAIGGQTFYFPQNTGMPLGTTNDPSFFMLETHYDNPTLKTDIVDSSGVRIFYTPTLRQYDAGIIETGVHVNKLQIVPPFENSFISTGFCPESALRDAHLHPNGVNVFAVLQHSHLLGRAIKTRLVKNGIEQEPLAVDNHYDFNYQDARIVQPERSIIPGDGIIVDCFYNSSHKSALTFGGLTTRDEMCLSFILYYPRIDLELCTSSPMYEKIDKDPTGAIQKLKTWNWRDASVRNKYKDLLENSTYYVFKSGKAMTPVTATMAYSRPTQPYIMPPSTCLNTTSNHVHVTQNKTLNTHATHSKPMKHLHNGQLTPTEVYTHETKLDVSGNYSLYWKVNKTHIVFEALVKTRGYIGFGISTNGKMYPSDVVVGWVADDGTPHLHDYHTVGHVMPVLDKSQDWVLLHGEENSTSTLLKFARKLDTCDHDDIKITDDTIHVIYSYHPNDPQSATSLPWHGGSRRGAKSMLLLSGPKEVNMAMPTDIKTFDFLNKNYHVPGKGTTYHCTTWKFPDLGQKHHLIKYEPIITPGNELNVHHILIYHCLDNVDETRFDAKSYECYTGQRIRELNSCYSVFVAWAIGGEAFYYPHNVGMSLGTSRDPSFFVMETHYDNPTLKTNMIDNSGIRMYYTPTLRQYDAGLIEVGVHVNRLQFIPPFEDNFLSQGYCSENCLRKGLKSQPQGIKVFGLIQHAHLLGRGIKTRIVRNGVEQEPMASDNNYDFNYQDVRVLREERTLMPGDGIIVDCMYNSSQRTSVTYGGLTTQEEMCLSFVFYYPRMDVEVCTSSPRYNDVSSNSYQAVNHLAHWNWRDPAVHQKFSNVLTNSTYTVACSGKHMSPRRTMENMPYFEPQHKYVDPSKGTCPSA